MIASLCFPMTFAVACTEKPPATKPEAGVAKSPAAPVTYKEVDRATFNRLATRLGTSLYWREDANNNDIIEPNEVASLWGVDSENIESWVVEDKFSDGFKEMYGRILSAARRLASPPRAEGREDKRRTAILKELDQGRATLVHSDFSDAPAADAFVVNIILEAATIIEQIYALQNNVQEYSQMLLDEDPASRMVFYRNQGPWCVAPQTENDPDCNAVSTFPKKISGLYPPELQTPGFCEKLAARKDADQLLSPFTVVRGRPSELAPKGYHEAYSHLMRRMSRLLALAAGAVDPNEEAAFKRYLEEAAQAFGTNKWEPADEAWSKMNAQNSKWYLRIGPDEVYFDPCNRKAGFHVSFATINRDSLRWQEKLSPVRQQMEAALAKLSAGSYRARKVAFKLPDFIDIIINAGDSRKPLGATIGQSLPNWGPVADERRGRTVAMTNLYTDPDSRADLRSQTESVLCADSARLLSDDQDAGVLGTVLHEAAHNLGPSHDYRVKKRTAPQIFGGPLASTLEELKAQTAALYLAEWLTDQKVLSPELQTKSRVRNLVWALGHISRGMYAGNGRPKPYSHLAAIQFGHLIDEKAIAWNATQKAPSGDTGCLSIDMNAWPRRRRKADGAGHANQSTR